MEHYFVSLLPSRSLNPHSCFPRSLMMINNQRCWEHKHWLCCVCAASRRVIIGGVLYKLMLSINSVNECLQCGDQHKDPADLRSVCRQIHCESSEFFIAAPKRFINEVPPRKSGEMLWHLHRSHVGSVSLRNKSCLFVLRGVFVCDDSKVGRQLICSVFK